MRSHGRSSLLVLSLFLSVLQACDGKARISGKGPRLHYTAIPARQPAELDLAIVMLDNRHIAPGDSVAKEKDAPCDDYWSASVAINRIFAELHGYHFYLWHDTHNAVRSSGCVEGDAWLRTALPDLLNPDPKKLHPAWQKMLPIYCHLKQHKMALWIDSDAYVADVYQPIEFLLHATRFIEGGKSALMSLDHPKQAGCKGCSGDSGPGLNTGLVLMKNTPTGLEMLRNWMGATFKWGDPTKVSTSGRWKTHWPWEQMAVNSGEKSLAKTYKDDIVVVPYGTPINGPHGGYIVHLWGWITGAGKKCKMLRAALKCTLDALPQVDTRTCYLRHASAASAEGGGGNATGGTACGWRPRNDAAGGLLPSGNRPLCTPTCTSLASKMEKQIRQPGPGAPLFGAIAPYKFHNLGLKACNNRLVGISKKTSKGAPVTNVSVSPEAAWEMLTAF